MLTITFQREKNIKTRATKPGSGRAQWETNIANIHNKGNIRQIGKKKRNADKQQGSYEKTNKSDNSNNNKLKVNFCLHAE
jgi:hypothetical protein